MKSTLATQQTIKCSKQNDDIFSRRWCFRSSSSPSFRDVLSYGIMCARLTYMHPWHVHAKATNEINVNYMHIMSHIAITVDNSRCPYEGIKFYHKYSCNVQVHTRFAIAREHFFVLCSRFLRIFFYFFFTRLLHNKTRKYAANQSICTRCINSNSNFADNVSNADMLCALALRYTF